MNCRRPVEKVKGKPGRVVNGGRRSLFATPVIEGATGATISDSHIAADR